MLRTYKLSRQPVHHTTLMEAIRRVSADLQRVGPDGRPVDPRRATPVPTLRGDGVVLVPRRLWVRGGSCSAGRPMSDPGARSASGVRVRYPTASLATAPSTASDPVARSRAGRTALPSGYGSGRCQLRVTFTPSGDMSIEVARDTVRGSEAPAAILPVMSDPPDPRRLAQRPALIAATILEARRSRGWSRGSMAHAVRPSQTLVSASSERCSPTCRSRPRSASSVRSTYRLDLRLVAPLSTRPVRPGCCLARCVAYVARRLRLGTGSWSRPRSTWRWSRMVRLDRCPGVPPRVAHPPA